MAAPPSDLATAISCGTTPASLPADTAGALCLLHASMHVDGKADDWPTTGWTNIDSSNAQVEAGSFSGVDAANLSGRYRLGWDQKYLYLIVEVTDDQRGAYASDCPDIYRGDSVELFLDGDHSRSKQYDSDDYQLIFAPTMTPCGLASYIEGLAQMTTPAGIQYATVENGGSWTLEAAVPFSLLGDVAVENGRNLGFDLQLDDYDSATYSANHAPARTLLWVQADTADDNPICGMGMQLPYCNPQAFGTVRLVGP